MKKQEAQTGRRATDENPQGARKGQYAAFGAGGARTREMYGIRSSRLWELESRQVFQMNEGTLYPILHALEMDGF